MRNWLPLCFVCFTAAVIAAPVQAQYLFVDSDGDQLCTGTDIVPPGEGRLDIWIDTTKNGSGEPAVCATGEDLTISSYEVVIGVDGVTTLGWENARPEFNQSLGFQREGMYVRAGFTSPGATTHLAPGLYKLGTLLTQWDGRCPIALPVPSALFSGTKHSTEFWSQCLGIDGDYWLRLGNEIADNCGTQFPCDAAEDQGTTWGKIKQQYLPK